MKAPLILELKGNSLDDGPGIRTAIFFKGCPLSCIWCHNPESKRVEAELSVSLADCIGCGTCESVCPQGAASPRQEGIVDRSKCVRCFSCTEECPPKALQRVGAEYSLEEIVEKCVKDKPFYDVSGGGVTLTGGEATLFPEWVGELSKALKEQGISIHLETCGLFSYDKVKEHMLPHISSIYMDVKIMDPAQHKKYCGASNEVILENFSKLLNDSKEMGFTLLPRTPLVPGITDTDDNLEAISQLYAELGVKKTELLPYNPTWYGKTEKLGIELADELKGVDSWQIEEKLDHCKGIFEQKGIECL